MKKESKVKDFLCGPYGWCCTIIVVIIIYLLIFKLIFKLPEESFDPEKHVCELFEEGYTLKDCARPIDSHRLMGEATWNYHSYCWIPCNESSYGKYGTGSGCVGESGQVAYKCVEWRDKSYCELHSEDGTRCVCEEYDFSKEIIIHGELGDTHYYPSPCVKARKKTVKNGW